MNNSTMHAFVLEGHGGMDKLVYHTDWPRPEPKDGEVLIKVEACGLNNTDVNTRVGWYSKKVTSETKDHNNESPDDIDAGQDDGSWGGSGIQFPRIQGGDAVGKVVGLGEGVTSDLVGKRVMIDTVLRDWDDPLNFSKCGYLGSERDGGFAEYISIDARNVLPIDCDLSSAELATFAISYSTAENMLDRAKVKAGDSVLVTGASGGVGSALIQLAKRRDASVIALASEAKHARVKEVGADVVLSRHPENLAKALEDATGKSTVSVVADVVGGDIFPELIEVIERGGRYTCAGAIAGPIVDFDLRTFYLHDLTFTGATILSLDVYPNLVSYIEKGEIRPVLAQSFPLKELHAAQKAFIDKKHTGNIVVTM